MRKRRIIVALSVLCILVMTAGCFSAQAESVRKKVTVMVYMCGSNLETNIVAQGTASISQMYSSRFNQDEVNVIALCGGSKKWASGLDPSVLSVVDVGKGTRRQPYVAETLPLASMGNPETLTNFLKLCYEKYPADSYDLVLWDHGGGALCGVCWDSLFVEDKREDNLTTQEVVDALAASPFTDQGLDLLVMHACLMASAEFAYKMSPFAKYYVASEDSQYGLNYAALNGIDTATPLETACRIVDDSYAENKATVESKNASETNSFAVIDLSKMQALKDAVDDFFAGISASLDKADFSIISGYRRDAQAFGYGESGGNSDYDLVDLGDLIRRYREWSPEKAEAVEAAINDAVLHLQRANEDCTGLTVYHPFLNKKYAEEWIGIYGTLDFAENYYRYIQEFARYLNDVPRAKWVDLDTAVPAASKDARTLFILSLTEEQAAQYGESALKVLQKGADGSYTFTYMGRDTSLNGTTVTGEYVSNALFPVAADGTKLSEAVTYSVDKNGNWQIPAVLVRKATEESDEVIHQALISCSYNRESRKLIPGKVLVRDEGAVGYTSAYGTFFTDYDEIRLSFVSRKETRDSNETLLPFEEWEESEVREWIRDIDGSWDFVLVPEAMDDTELFVTFEVTDCQNNFYSSNLWQVSGEGPQPIPNFVITYDDANLVRISTEKARVNLGSDQLQITLTVQNLTEEESIIRLENLAVNGSALDAYAEAFGTGDHWGLLKDEEQMLTVTVPGTDLPEGTVTEILFDLTLRNAQTDETIGAVSVKISVNPEQAAP